MSIFVVHRLPKLSQSSLTTTCRHSFIRNHSQAHLFSSKQRQLQKLPFFPFCSSFKPFRLSYQLNSALSFSSENKSSDFKPPSIKVDLQETAQSTVAAKASQKTRLKQAVRDYGATIIVFHVAISLASLGICYLAISNGVDAVRLLSLVGFSESVISSKVAVGGSTFVIAYAVHKVFAPVRIGITLSVAPFIVRYLRRINWLKPPKKKE